MVIFATYADCDLKEQGEITTGDQVENGAKSPRESVGHCYILMLHINKVVCRSTQLSISDPQLLWHWYVEILDQ